MALVPGGRAGGPEDLHPVSRRDGKEPLHVRRSLERRQNALGGGLTCLSHKTLEQKRLEADQGRRSVCLRDERVGHSLGTERERTGRQSQARVADVERELAVNDVEPLVLVRVGVPG